MNLEKLLYMLFKAIQGYIIFTRKGTKESVDLSQKTNLPRIYADERG